MIDTTILDNWPDPAAVRGAGDQLATAGSDYHQRATDLQSTWNKLNNGAVYDTPERGKLVKAADKVPEQADHVKNGTDTIKAALHAFAEIVDGLNKERATLLSDISSFQAQPAPNGADAGKVQEHSEKQDALKGRVDALAKAFETAVHECADAIDKMDDNGNPHNGNLDFLKMAKGPAFGLAGIPIKNIVVNQSREFSQMIMRAFGVDFGIPFTKRFGDIVTTSDPYFKPKAGDLTRVKSFGEFASSFGDKMRDRFLVEPNKPWGEAAPKSDVLGDKNFGMARETFEQTRTTKTGFSRWGGRALSVVGTGLAMLSEGEKRYDDLGAQHPEMTDGERRDKAVEAGIVRGGSQALVAGATTAAVCSVVPGIGTVGGFVVGTAVGFGMSLIPTGDGKNINDRVGDLGEKAWNGVKSWFH